MELTGRNTITWSKCRLEPSEQITTQRSSKNKKSLANYYSLLDSSRLFYFSFSSLLLLALLETGDESRLDKCNGIFNRTVAAVRVVLDDKLELLLHIKRP